MNKGLTVGANYERDDQRTATTLDELTFEAIDTARPDTRPHDQIGLLRPIDRHPTPSGSV